MWLPEVKRDGGSAELETIVDRSQGHCGGGSGACIDWIFGPTSALPRGYWSASTRTPVPDFAWVANFFNGNVVNGNKRPYRHARAVRAGSD